MSAGEYYGSSWPFGVGDFPSFLGQCGPLGDLRNNTDAERLAHESRLQQQADDFWDRMLQQAQGPPSFNCDYWLKRGGASFWYDPGVVQIYERPSQEDLESQMREALRGAKFNPPLGGECLPYTGPRNKKPSRFRRLASWLRSKWPPAFWLRWKQNRLWKRRQREYDEQMVNAIVSGLTAR